MQGQSKQWEAVFLPNQDEEKWQIQIECKFSAASKQRPAKETIR